MKVLDGPSGRTRWVRPMSPETAADDGPDHLLEAPDLDGDGVRDLIVVSHFDGRQPARVPRRESLRARPRVRRCALGPGRATPLVLARGPGGRQDRPHLAAPMVGPRAGRLAGAGDPARRAESRRVRLAEPAPSTSIPQPCMSWRPRRGASGTGPWGWAAWASATSTATASSTSGARPKAGSRPSAASRPRRGARSARSPRPEGLISTGTGAAIVRPPTSTATGSPIP